MLNRKGFVITPILFVVFFIIAITFSFYVSDIDNEMSYGIQKSAVIEKSMHDIQKEQLNIINFATISTYNCSDVYAYPCNQTPLENCVKNDLKQINDGWNWEYKILDQYRFELKLPRINATNINMSSDTITVKGELSQNFFRRC